MIVQGDAQQDVEMAECVSGRVCLRGCAAVGVYESRVDL